MVIYLILRIIINIRRDIYYETIVEMDKKGCDNLELNKVIDQLNLLTMKTVIQFDIELDLLGELSRM